MLETEGAMQDVLQALNRMVAGRRIEGYAIGGGVAAAFHLEPTQTETLQVLVLQDASRSGTSEPPLRESLAAGGVAEHDPVRLETWLVRLDVAASNLEVEAILGALPVHFAGIPTRVASVEHLCALAVQSGDSADLLRVAMFFEHGKVDRRRLTALAQRHGLLEALQILERRLFPPLSAPVSIAGLDARKTALNIRMKAQLRAHLQARSWEDKVAAMQAMTLALKRAREALRGATSAAAARGE